MATNIPPEEDFTFENSTLTTSESLEEGCDAWEGVDYTSVHLHTIGSDIDYDWAIEGQPPGLDIADGIVSGTVECDVFKTFVEDIVKERERGNQTIDLGSDEYPSPYEIGSGDVIKRDFDVIVSGMDSDPDPDVYVEEEYVIRLGKNMRCDVGDFDARDWWTEKVEEEGY